MKKSWACATRHEELDLAVSKVLPIRQDADWKIQFAQGQNKTSVLNRYLLKMLLMKKAPETRNCFSLQ